MATTLDHPELRTIYCFAVSLAMSKWYEPIVPSPDNQRRRLHPAQSMDQLWIVHIRLPAKPLRHNLAVIAGFNLLGGRVVWKQFFPLLDLSEIMKRQFLKLGRSQQKYIG